MRIHSSIGRALFALLLASPAGCLSGESESEPEAPPAESSVHPLFAVLDQAPEARLAAGVLHTARVEVDGVAYRLAKTYTKEEGFRRLAFDTSGRALADEEVVRLEGTLAEQGRAPRVDAALRDLSEVEGEVEVTVELARQPTPDLGTNDSAEVTRALERYAPVRAEAHEKAKDGALTRLGLTAAAVIERHQGASMMKLRVPTSRIPGLIRAVEDGEIEGVQLAGRKLRKLFTALLPNESMRILKQDIALKRVGPHLQSLNVGVYFECPLSSDLGMLGVDPAHYAPQGCDIDPTHANDVLSLIHIGDPTRDSYAPFANMWVHGGDVLSSLSWFNLNGVGVINGSNEVQSSEQTAYIDSNDVAHDRLVNQYPFPTAVFGAGNDNGGHVGRKGFNSIKVAMAMENPNGSWDLPGASVNPASPHGDRELPELAAPGSCGLDWAAYGSSCAAPVVTGIAATIQSDFGAAYLHDPTAVRAALLVAGNKLTSATWWQNVAAHVDQKDGAGMVDADAALRAASVQPTGWASPPLYLPTGVYSSGLGFGGSNALPQQTISGVDSLKVALTWQTDEDGVAPNADMDLWLLDDQGSRVAYSGSYDNNYEILETTSLDPTRTYTLSVHRYDPGAGKFLYSLAWRTDLNRIHVHRMNAYGYHFYANYPEGVVGGDVNMESWGYYDLQNTQRPGTVPFLRCRVAGTGAHYYTTLSSCQNNVPEGQLGYAATSALPGTIPLYSVYSPATGDYFYATNWGEAYNAWALYGYSVWMSPAAYVWPSTYAPFGPYQP